MATLSIRMPDDTYERLKHLATARSVSMKKLIEEFSIAALAEFDAEALSRLFSQAEAHRARLISRTNTEHRGGFCVLPHIRPQQTRGY